MVSAGYWKFFAGDAERTGSALYARLAEGVGNDADLRAIAALAAPGQPHANMLFGAVHFLLLRGAMHPLRAFYRDLNGGKTEEGDPLPAFRDFCLSNRAQLEALIETRVTNTNETGRSAILHPGLRAVAALAGEPLYLIEIGPSAGLNLIWDRYGVRYTKDGATAAQIAPDAPLILDCALRGAKMPPHGAAPRVAGRVGLERHPVDLSNPDDRDWLRALVWPDQDGRRERLDKAIALFAQTAPEIRVGDALALLPDALATAPAHAAVCVYHTIVLYQFDREMRAALEDILTVAGLRRPVHRLSFEFAGGDARDQYQLDVIAYRDGARTARRLANGHPHGAWLEWQA